MEAMHRQAMPEASFSGRRDLHELEAGRNLIFSRVHAGFLSKFEQRQLHSLQRCCRAPSWSAAAVRKAKAVSAAAVADAYQPSIIGAEQDVTFEQQKDLNKEAMALADSGDVQGAVSALVQLTNKFPTNARFPTSAAVLEGRRGNMAAARVLFQRAIDCCPTDMIPIKAWGMLEARQGDPEIAIKLFKEYLKVNPEDVNFLNARAKMERLLGNEADCEALLRRALDIDPGHTYSLQALGALEGKRGRSRQARQLLQKGLAGDPKHPALRQALALLEWREGNITRARNIFRRAVRECSPHAPLLSAWADCEASKGVVTRARRLYRQALVVDATNTRALLGLASLEARAGNISEALKQYIAGLELDPGNVHLLHSAAQMHVTLGNSKEARELLGQVLQQQPRNGHALHTLGLLERQAGQHAEAGRLFRKGTATLDLQGRLLNYEALAHLQEFDLEPSIARATFQAGMRACGRSCTSRYLREFASFEKRQRNHDEAARLFDAAIRADPFDDRALLLWAMLERRRKNWAKARSLFQKGAALTRRNSYVYHGWAVMERQAGDVDAARQVLQQGIAQCPRAKSAPLLLELALLEVSEGNAAEARRLFELGSQPQVGTHPPLLEAWAAFEKQQGNTAAVAKLQQRLREVEKQLSSSDQQLTNSTRNTALL